LGGKRLLQRGEDDPGERRVSTKRPKRSKRSEREGYLSCRREGGGFRPEKERLIRGSKKMIQVHIDLKKKEGCFGRTRKKGIYRGKDVL